MDHKIDGLALVPLLTPVVDKRCRASQVPVAEGVREQMQLFGDNYSSISATIRIPFEEPAARAPSLPLSSAAKQAKEGAHAASRRTMPGPGVMAPRVVWPACSSSRELVIFSSRITL